MWIIHLFLSVLSAVLIIIFISFCIQLIIMSKRGHRIIVKSDTPSTFIRRGILKRLFIDFPGSLARDLLNRNPDAFPLYGIHCFCGEQGSGKTSAMVAKLRELKQKYPKVLILTNFDCIYSDGLIKDWKDIVFTNNGSCGIVIALDEIQNWFSTNESKDFPPELLQEICQQRKQYKMVLCTSQRFQRMSKQLREQVNFLYEPFTFLGCLTFVRVRKPFVDDDGKLDRYRTRKRGTYFFVHDDELRNSYDTFEKIKRQANGGYTANPLTKEPSTPNINVAIDARRRKL